jgi:site-specific DNA-cytosine methylase
VEQNQVKILIACEYSGIVRDAFIRRGHNAVSCDLLETENPGPHIVGDVLKILNDGWDLMVGFPPCTDLAVSGARWFPEKRKDGRQDRSIAFFLALANAPIEKIAIENPVGIMSTHYRKPDQIIQPWQYGHGETKATCLWLKNLEVLRPSNIVSGRENRIWKMGPSENRWKERSKTYTGIAEAMAEQWSKCP